jgi:hypothetical protein
MSSRIFGQSLMEPNDQDHLEPPESYFAIWDHEKDYFPFIYKHLLKDLSDRPVARLLILPSFFPENVVSVESMDKDDLKYRIIYKTCSESVWKRKNRNAVEVIKYEGEVDSAIVNVIKKVFRIALLKTRYNEIDGIGFDGVSYIFSGTFGLSATLSGEIWSPNEGTKMYELVEFGESMIALAKADNNSDRQRLKKEIKENGERLFKRISGE